EHTPTFGQMVSDVPEVAQRHGDLETCFELAGIETPADRRAEIAQLALKAAEDRQSLTEPAHAGRTGRPRRGQPGRSEIAEIRRMSGSDRRRLPSRFEPFDGVFTDGLEHLETVVRGGRHGPQQASVDQRRREIERIRDQLTGRIDYGLDGVQLRATREGTEPPEESSLRFGQQIVAPVDRPA